MVRFLCYSTLAMARHSQRNARGHCPDLNPNPYPPDPHGKRSAAEPEVVEGVSGATRTPESGLCDGSAGRGRVIEKQVRFAEAAEVVQSGADFIEG